MCSLIPVSKYDINNVVLSNTVTETRQYNSPLRAHQTEQTRLMLLQAAAEEIVANGPSGMTMSAIADRAGVSERTVYRHFPDRQALIDGLTEWVDSQIADRLGRNFEEVGDFDLDGLIEQAHRVFVTMEEIGLPAEAMVIASQSGEPKAERHVRRNQMFEQLFEDELADVDDTLKREVFAVTRVLFGSHTWYTMTRELGLTAEEAGEAVSATIRNLLERVRSPET